MVSKEKKIEDVGQVIESLPDVFFKVKLESGEEVLAHGSGKIRKYRIRILVGDRVKVERSSYDLARGRIVYRFK
ncbi:translation initiation factor IF-1 [Patescibacteria group bacterium]|nr:translation initiation factor IF-1 [Patescibacteria group bacterium]MBU1868682.1 translation initiation factor IF-1 [Patescibacteria group bacterium]